MELNRKELENLCRRYLRDNVLQADDVGKSMKMLDCRWENTSDAPMGFLGRHQFLTIEIALNNSDVLETMQLFFFAKSAPVEISSRMAYINEFGVFNKEIIVCRDVIPKLQYIMDTSFAPKCYYAHNNLLIFDNLSKDDDYKIAAHRDGVLDYDHLQCSLKSLAAMHASSIIYEHMNGGKFNEHFSKAVQENAYPLSISCDHVRKQNFDNAVLVMQSLTKQMSKYTDNISYILKEIPKKMSKIFELAQTSTKYKNTFSHGDLWANNIMFRYGNLGAIPIDCRFVDFQLARYAPPVLDVITILTIPTTREFREKYLWQLLSTYYGFMKHFLEKVQLKIEDIIPEEEFYDSVQEFRVCGLIESFLFSHLTILPPQLTHHLTESAEGFDDFFKQRRVSICNEAFLFDDIYKFRLSDMIEDFVDRFILNK